MISFSCSIQNNEKDSKLLLAFTIVLQFTSYLTLSKALAPIYISHVDVTILSLFFSLAISSIAHLYNEDFFSLLVFLININTVVPPPTVSLSFQLPTAVQKQMIFQAYCQVNSSLTLHHNAYSIHHTSSHHTNILLSYIIRRVSTLWETTLTLTYITVYCYKLLLLFISYCTWLIN